MYSKMVPSSCSSTIWLSNTLSYLGFELVYRSKALTCPFRRPTNKVWGPLTALGILEYVLYIGTVTDKREQKEW